MSTIYPFESELHSQWQSSYPRYASDSELIAALAPNMIEPAQIFCVAYQLAIRSCFPQLEQSPSWLSFAATEKRDLDNPARIEDQKLYGHKAWIAAVEHLGGLIVKLGKGPATSFVYCNAEALELEFTTNPKGRFLPELSQGYVHFHGAQCELIQDHRAADFSAKEAYYVYLVFLQVLNTLAPQLMSSDALAEASDQDLKTLDQKVQDCLAAMAEHNLVIGDNWAQDQRLFRMYSPRIQDS